MLDNEAQAESALAGGLAAAVLVIPPRFGAERAAGHSSEVQVRLDASDPISVGSRQTAISGLIMTIDDESNGAPPVKVNLVTRYNPEASTAVYIVPGLVGVILSMTLILLTAIAVARERERGTLEALFASPVQSWEIIVGKLLPGVVVGYLQMAMILGLGAYFFRINPMPVLVPMIFVGGLFIAANLAIGLLISTAVQTHAQAMQLAMLTLLPNILLSGFMFPIAAMPLAARWFAECLPLTHFLRVDRGLLLKGADLAHLTSDVTALAGVLIALMVLAVWRVRTRLT